MRAYRIVPIISKLGILVHLRLSWLLATMAMCWHTIHISSQRRSGVKMHKFKHQSAASCRFSMRMSGAAHGALPCVGLPTFSYFKCPHDCLHTDMSSSPKYFNDCGTFAFLTKLMLTLELWLDAQSRLIAVSSNRREVTIFAHGYTTFRETGGEESPVFKLKRSIRYLELQASAGNQKFTQFVDGDIAGYRQFNCRYWWRLYHSYLSLSDVTVRNSPSSSEWHGTSIVPALAVHPVSIFY